MAGYGDEAGLESMLALARGTVIDGRYCLDTKLGHGGMGEVWKAYDERLGTPVALKILRGSADLSEETEVRFEREMRVMNTMDSPLVVAIHDRGCYCGRMYLVMAFLEGQDMESALDEGPLPWPEVLRILASVAEVLQEAHARGLLHRDLKPANIFLQSIPGRTESVVRVLDFGVAKIFGQASIDDRHMRELTQLGSVVGTPKYMAPEQFSGEARVASDLYSIGVVAYQALSGVLPFLGPTLPQIAFQHCSAPVPRLPPVIPSDVARLVMDLLVKEPEKRIPTAEQVRIRIDDILSARRSAEAHDELWAPSHRALSSVERDVAASRLASMRPSSRRPSSAARMVSRLRNQVGSRADSTLDDDQVTIMADQSPLAEPHLRPLSAASMSSAASHDRGRFSGWSLTLDTSGRWRTPATTFALIGCLLLIVLAVRLSLRPNITVEPVTPDGDVAALDNFPPPGMILIPEGPFLMGCNHTFDEDCGLQDRELESVSVAAFYIDQVEVSVSMYYACIQAGGCSEEGLAVPSSGGVAHSERSQWCNWGRRGRRRHPINCLSWKQARAFCEWSGKRLPSGIEWEKAARGTGGQLFPWGDAPPSCRWVVMSDGGTGCGRGTTWPVSGGEQGESPYGVLHMAGNVAEWTSSVADDDGSEAQRIYRGGSWGSEDAKELRTHYRVAADSEDRFNTVGVRCAWSPPDSGGSQP